LGGAINSGPDFHPDQDQIFAGHHPKMRVLFGARLYLIDSIIDPEERHIEMQVMCQEWVAT